MASTCAGADIIETNTFGANRIKLRGFGLADRLRDINVEGARLARGAANGQAYVAGAIGPLGIRIEPWGRTSKAEAEAYFREQAEALLAGGVDLFVMETFRDVTELLAATAAIRSICDLPVVAQMTIEEDGNSFDGAPPDDVTSARALGVGGADALLDVRSRIESLLPFNDFGLVGVCVPVESIYSIDCQRSGLH